jgi:hypothetical protein
MATEASHYLADLFHGAIFGGEDISVPTKLVVKIFETLPDLDDAGGVETAYDGYIAQDVLCGASSEWSAPAVVSGAVCTDNAAKITFPESEETEDTIHAAGYGVYDDLDNLMWIETKAFDIAPGFQPEIDVGGMVFGFKSSATASYDLQTKLLTAICRNTEFTALTSVDVEEYVTAPNKADSGGVEASYTGYAAGTPLAWEGPSDSAGMRLVSNSAEFDCGVANSSADQVISANALRDSDSNLLFVAAYDAPFTLQVGAKITHKANAIQIRF